MPDEVFLDTAYAIALSSGNDLFHEQAASIAEQLESRGTRLVTTRAVPLEIGNALARLRYRAAAVQLLDAPMADPNVEILPVSDFLFSRALHLYRNRYDKEWG